MKLLSYIIANAKENIVDIANWKEFNLSNIFSVERGNRLIVSKRIKGEIPFVTAGFENQGTADFIGNTEIETYQNAITIDMFGNSFYKKDIFSCDDNILVLQNDNLNELNGLFIASIISKVCADFSYAKQYRLNTFYKQTIYLPVDSEGNPDWQHMEDYIKNIYDEQQKIVL